MAKTTISHWGMYDDQTDTFFVNVKAWMQVYNEYFLLCSGSKEQKTELLDTRTGALAPLNSDGGSKSNRCKPN